MNEPQTDSFVYLDREINAHYKTKGKGIQDDDEYAQGESAFCMCCRD
jgi:hypothetical protein